MSRVVFTGLLISLVPAPSLGAMGVRQAPVAVVPQKVQKELQLAKPGQPKDLQKEIEKKIKTIQNITKILRWANVAIPAIVLGAGFTALLAGALLAFGFVFPITLFLRGPGVSPVSTPLLIFFNVIRIDAAGTFIAFVASAIAPTGINIAGSIIMLNELERWEKLYPEILTDPQKLAITQLKNILKYPVVKGIIKYFEIEKALKKEVVRAMEQDPALVAKIAFGKRGKARKTIMNYIKLAWQEQSMRAGLDILKKERPQEAKKLGKKAAAEIEKVAKKRVDLEIKHPYLMQSPEMDATLARFSKKAAQLLEEFKKPLEQKKKQAPVVVPL